MYHGGEAFVGFLITCGNASEALELTEEVFDQMGPLLHGAAASSAVLPASRRFLMHSLPGSLTMTPLRRRIIEDMQVRNLSTRTQRNYLRTNAT